MLLLTKLLTRLVRRGELIAADCVNRPRDFVFSKRLLTQAAQGVGRAELPLGHLSDLGA